MATIIESRGDRSWVYEGTNNQSKKGPTGTTKDTRAPIRVHATGDARTALDFLKSAFLPIGYPDSVSDDYLEYQIWDTGQAFCSSINNILSHHALLQGYGVGDAKATASAAMITWMLRDGLSMMGRILFAYSYASTLDADSKYWRLVADVLNDLAICIEIAAPAVGVATMSLAGGVDGDGDKDAFWAVDGFVVCACVGSLMKAIVGVAGGATRAALTQHQALTNNAADVAAKDGSQEQMVQLVALVFGMLLTQYTDTHPYIIWPSFALLTVVHLLCNYKAVTCLVYTSLNSERAKIVLNNYLQHGRVITPKQVADIEPLIPSGSVCMRFDIKLGCSVDRLLSCDSNRCTDTRDKNNTSPERALKWNTQYGYSIGFSYDGSSAGGTIAVGLEKGIVSQTLTRAFLHACLLALWFSAPDAREREGESSFEQKFLKILKVTSAHEANINAGTVDASYAVMDSLWADLSEKMVVAGWNLAHSHLPIDEWRIRIQRSD